MTNSGPEFDPAPDVDLPDEATDPDPQTLADLETYEEAGPGAPTAEELAADDNLYPEATGDDVPDGSQIPTGGDLPPEESEGNDV